LVVVPWSETIKLVRAKAIKIAAHMLEAAPEDVEFAEGAL
jgi:hypothetical protein